MARLFGQPVLALRPDGRVVAAAGFPTGDMPSRMEPDAALQRMAGGATATPATWRIAEHTYRAFGMRWPGQCEPLIVARLVLVDKEPFREVTTRLAALEQAHHATQHALQRTKAAERTARQRATELESTNRDLEDHAAVVAHNLRSPLRRARILGERIVHGRAEGLEDVVIEDLHGRFDRALEGLDQVILRMVEFADLRDVVPVLNHHDAASLVACAIDDLGSRVDGDAEITVEAEGDVVCDRALMTRAVGEVVANAVAYRAADRLPVVHVRVAPDNGGHQSMVVTDNGIGIPAHLRNRAMRPGERLNPDSGSGWGLSICRRILERHAGTVELGASPHGVGATVRLTWPGGAR